MSNVKIKGGLEDGNGLNVLQVQSDGTVRTAIDPDDRTVPVVPPPVTTDEKVKTTSDDTTAKYLSAAIEDSDTVTVEIVDTSGNKTLKLHTVGGGTIDATAIAPAVISVNQFVTSVLTVDRVDVDEIADGTTASGAGAGKTLTFSATGAQVVDGTPSAMGERYLFNGAPSTSRRLDRGIYTPQTLWDFGVAEVWVRTTDWDECIPEEAFPGRMIKVTGGSKAGTEYITSLASNSAGQTIDVNFRPSFLEVTGGPPTPAQAIVGSLVIYNLDDITEKTTIDGTISTRTLNVHHNGLNDATATIDNLTVSQITDLSTTNISQANIGQLGLGGATAVDPSPPIADATDGTDVITQLNTLLAYLRSRGDIQS